MDKRRKLRKVGGSDQNEKRERSRSPAAEKSSVASFFAPRPAKKAAVVAAEQPLPPTNSQPTPVSSFFLPRKSKPKTSESSGSSTSASLSGSSSLAASVSSLSADSNPSPSKPRNSKEQELLESQEMKSKSHVPRNSGDSGDSKCSSVEDNDEEGEDLDKALEKALAHAVDSESEASEEDQNDDGDEKDDDEDGERKRPRKMNKVKREERIEKESEPSSEGRFSNKKYHPLNSATWSKGQKVPYAFLAELFAECEGTSKRLDMTRFLSNFFRSVITLSPEYLLACVYLCCNRIAPAYSGKELGIGDGTLLKALSEATGSTPAKLKSLLVKLGDLGETAQQSRSNQRTLIQPPPLTVPGVFNEFKRMSEVAGKDANNKKKTTIKSLLVACRGEEAKFMARALQGNLRIGLQAKTVMAALARAVVLTPPRQEGFPPPILNSSKGQSAEKVAAEIERVHKILAQAFIEAPSYDLLVDAILNMPIDEIPQRIHLTPGVPIQVMLGKPAKGIEAILERFAGSLFTIEFKYDGERAQIHLLSDGSVKIYSRNSEDNTGKYPDLVTDTLPAVKDERTVSAIIDTEVVAYDPESKKILPFQTLSTRKRKVVDQATIQVQVCLFAFDLLFHNGKSYLEEPFAVRREVLHSHFKPVEGKFQFAEFKDTNDPEDIQAFLTQSVAASCEGLMVKALTTDAGYIPAKRNWLKVKKDYLDGVGDTLDLVPIGAWHGKGKRKGVYGAYLLAIYDEESETYQSICKIGTGFSDEDLESRAKSLSEFEIDAPPRYYQFPEAMACDVYFSPAQVWEVLCADLSISPVHCAAAGLVHESKGIALRFPRFVRLREDKKPEEATSAAQVVDFYQNQSVRT